MYSLHVYVHLNLLKRICACESGFKGEDLKFFSDTVFAETTEILLINVCKTFCDARFDFLEEICLRKLKAAFDVILLIIIYC